MSTYSPYAPNQNSGAQIWGQGTITTSDGYWVPNQGGNGGYTFQPLGSQPGGNQATSTDWTQAGGGAGGSNYFDYGSALSGGASTPAGTTYSKPVSQAIQQNLVSALPGGGYNNPNNPYANGQIDPIFSTGQMDPVTQYMQQNGVSYAAAQKALSGQSQAPTSSQDLMSQINQYYALAGMPQQGQQQGGYDPASQLPQTTPGMGAFGQPLLNYANQVFSNTMAPAYPELQDYQQQSQTYGGGSAPQSGPGAGWTQDAVGNWHLNGTGLLTSTAQNYGASPYAIGVGANGQQVYVDQSGREVGPVNQQQNTFPPPATGTPLAVPGPGGQQIGIPGPTPYNPGNIAPTAPPSGPPQSPWSIGGGAAAPTQPAPTAVAPSTVSPQPQPVQFGSPAAYYDQAMGFDIPQPQQYENYQSTAQFQPEPQVSPQTQSPTTTSGQPINYGGTGMSFQSLIGLLGQVPQAPNLSNIIQAPNVDSNGGFSNQPGGAPIRMSIQPVITGQQQQQLINQATGSNARQAATQQNQNAENMAARGWSTNSAAVGDANRQVEAARMMADTNAYSQIPLNVQKLNTDSAMQQMGLNLQGQQNAISGYNAYADLMKNQGNLAAQGYGLDLSGYNTYQDSLASLLGIGVQQGNLGVQQYLADLNAYNAGQNANNSYYGNLLNAGQLGLQANSQYYQNLLGLGGLTNQAQQNDNSLTLGLINSLMNA